MFDQLRSLDEVDRFRSLDSLTDIAASELHTETSGLSPLGNFPYVARIQIKANSLHTQLSRGQQTRSVAESHFHVSQRLSSWSKRQMT